MCCLFICLFIYSFIVVSHVLKKYIVKTNFPKIKNKDEQRLSFVIQFVITIERVNTREE